MIQIAVVYFSETGATGKLAEALMSGLESISNVSVIEHRIAGHEIVEGRFENQDLLTTLTACDGIVFGTPTYMGGVSAQLKAFIDATSELWCEQEWAGKIAAGFTCGSSFNGDQSSTLQYLITLASQQGMFWIGLDSATGYKDHGVNRLGCQLGVVAHTPDDTVHGDDLATATYLGRRVAQYAIKLQMTNSVIGAD